MITQNEFVCCASECEMLRFRCHRSVTITTVFGNVSVLPPARDPSVGVTSTGKSAGRERLRPRESTASTRVCLALSWICSTCSRNRTTHCNIAQSINVTTRCNIVQSINGTTRCNFVQPINGTTRYNIVQAINGTTRCNFVQPINGTTRYNIVQSINVTTRCNFVQPINGTTCCNSVQSISVTTRCNIVSQ